VTYRAAYDPESTIERVHSLPASSRSGVSRGDFDGVRMTKLDRIGRDSMDVQATVELCAAEGVRLIVLQLGNLDLTLSSGALMVKVLAAVADFERELIVERTRAGQARAHAAGTHMGRPAKTTEAQRRTIRSRLAQGNTVSAVARYYKL
jgi:putative DNA-invertase from lambdoid prophage Rac